MAVSINLKVQTNSTPNGLGETIELLNFNNIWRKNSAQTFNIQVPQGYECFWEIVDSRTFVRWDAGRGTSVTETFTRCSDDIGLPQFYDIIAYARKGTLMFQRRFRRAITVLPPLFTRAQADVIWNFASGGVTYRDNNWVDRPGYKVWCEGFYTGASWLGLEEFLSSNPETPVHLLADTVNGCGIMHTGTNYCLKFVEAKNVLLDGCGNPSIPYGFQFVHTASGAQSLFIESSRSTTSLSQTSANIHVCGVSIDGGNVLVGAGLECLNATSGATTYGNWVLDGLTIHDCYIKNTLSEGLYIGYNNDGAGSAAIDHFVLCRTKTEHTGADGIQFGLTSGEVHDCTQIDGGWKNDPNHRNEVQWNPGCSNMFFYRNKCYSGLNTFSANLGLKYKNYCEVFSNLFINRTSPVPSNFFINLYQNDFTSTVDFKVFSNTVIAPNAGASSVPFYIARPQPTVTTEFNRLILANNLLVSGTTTQYGTLNISSPPANSTIANYITTNINTPSFKNQASDNFKLSTLSSPAFSTTNKTFTPVHPLAGEDIEGVKFLTDVQGCYSGYELMT